MKKFTELFYWYDKWCISLMSASFFGPMHKGDTLRFVKGVCEKGKLFSWIVTLYCFFHMLEADVGIN